MSSTERTSAIALVVLGLLGVANVVAALIYGSWLLLVVAVACFAILGSQWSAAKRASED